MGHQPSGTLTTRLQRPTAAARVTRASATHRAYLLLRHPRVRSTIHDPATGRNHGNNRSASSDDQERVPYAMTSLASHAIAHSLDVVEQRLHVLAQLLVCRQARAEVPVMSKPLGCQGAMVDGRADMRTQPFVLHEVVRVDDGLS